jgi:predicted Zn-dependent protease
MNRTTWTMVGVVIALSVAVFVWVIYSMVMHEEQGLLTGCERADHALDYTGECFEVVWAQRMPLKMRVVGEHDPWQQKALAEAAHSLNDELGFDAFVLVGVESVDVTASFDAPAEEGSLPFAGRVRHYADSGGLKVNACALLLKNVVLADQNAVVLRHELGHVLGLAHDAEANSLMTDKPLESGRFYPMTARDRERLRALYMGGAR